MRVYRFGLITLANRSSHKLRPAVEPETSFLNGRILEIAHIVSEGHACVQAACDAGREHHWTCGIYS